MGANSIVKDIYVLVPDRSSLTFPLPTKSNFLDLLVKGMSTVSENLKPISWRKLVTNPQNITRTLMAVVPVIGDFPSANEKINEKRTSHFIVETSPQVAMWDLSALDQLKHVVLIKWPDPINVENVAGVTTNCLLDLAQLQKLGTKISVMELQHSRAELEILLYFALSISRSNFKGRSLESYYSESCPGSGDWRCEWSNFIQPAQCLSMFKVRLTERKSPIAMQLASILKQLQCGKNQLHPPKEMIIMTNEKRVNKRDRCNTPLLSPRLHGRNRTKNASIGPDFESRRKYFGKKELSAILPGSSIVCVSQTKALDFEVALQLLRSKTLAALCMTLPLNLSRSDLRTLLEISLLDNTIVLPPSSSSYCVSEENFKAFLDQALLLMRELVQERNARYQRGFIQQKESDSKLHKQSEKAKTTKLFSKKTQSKQETAESARTKLTTNLSNCSKAAVKTQITNFQRKCHTQHRSLQKTFRDFQNTLTEKSSSGESKNEKQKMQRPANNQ